MRKSTLFISAALTTFMLAVLFGVVSAYQGTVKSAEVAAAQPQVQSTSAPVVMVNEPPASPAPIVPTQPVNITPDAAAAIAGKVLGRTDLYSVENVQFEGADAYLVTFSSGDLVYLSLDGQVLSISKIKVTVITQPGSKHGGGGGGGGNSGGGGGGNTGGGGGEHQGSDD
jgi:hypothetical protein